MIIQQNINDHKIVDGAISSVDTSLSPAADTNFPLAERAIFHCHNGNTFQVQTSSIAIDEYNSLVIDDIEIWFKSIKTYKLLEAIDQRRRSPIGGMTYKVLVELKEGGIINGEMDFTNRAYFHGKSESIRVEIPVDEVERIEFLPD